MDGGERMMEIPCAVGNSSCCKHMVATVGSLEIPRINLVVCVVLLVSYVAVWLVILNLYRKSFLSRSNNPSPLIASTHVDTEGPILSINRPESRGRDDVRSGSWSRVGAPVFRLHFILVSIFAALALLLFIFVLVPSSPAVRVIRLMLYQARQILPVFFACLLVVQGVSPQRLSQTASYVFSAAFSIIAFGITFSFAVAMSRSAVDVHVADVLKCDNCPLFYYAGVTVLPSVISAVIWLVSFIFLCWKPQRLKVGSFLFTYGAIFASLNVVGGSLVLNGIKAPYALSGLCYLCVVHILEAATLPWILFATFVRDSRDLKVHTREQGTALAVATETRSLLGDHDQSDEEDANVHSVEVINTEAYPSNDSIASMFPSAPRTDGERFAVFLLSNLNPEVPVLEYNDIEKEKKIGMGGFGEVFKGRVNGQTVAIKRILDVNMKKVKTFLREINTMAELQHPNIVKLVGVAVSSHDSFLVTEFVERGSLFDILHPKRGKPKPRIEWEDCLTILLGTCHGMQYLHGMNPPFLHRDLKSQNLLIEKGFGVKLCDFGMARVRSLAYTMTKLGTLQWVAPEVLRDERYSEKADIYSFAILIWELVVRKVPYVGKSNLQVARAVAYQGLRPDIPSFCPVELNALMGKCWDEDPSSRPSFDEIVEFVEDLDFTQEEPYPHHKSARELDI